MWQTTTEASSESVIKPKFILPMAPRFRSRAIAVVPWKTMTVVEVVRVWIDKCRGPVGYIWSVFGVDVCGERPERRLGCWWLYLGSPQTCEVTDGGGRRSAVSILTPHFAEMA